MEPGLNVFVRLTFRVSALFDKYPVGSRYSKRTAVSGRPKKAGLKTFHATLAVTRLEEWCVDAETAEEAKALLAAGQGHRCNLGDCLHIQLEGMDEAA